jgi:hypothetical protein
MFIICIVVPELPAQRYIPGQRGLQFTAGTVNGLDFNVTGRDFAFYAGVAMSAYTKRTDRWIVGVEYLEKRYIYRGWTVPQAQITIDAGYYLKFYSDWRKMLFLSVGASGMGGYETVNWNNKLLPDGATINNRDTFLYGGALTFELETYLSDRFVFLINVRERLLIGSSLGKFNTQTGLGIKFIIN